MKILLTIILLSLSYQIVSARIIHVPADSSTIQKGINGSNNGDTVLVARGTYYENIDFKGKNILVASNYISDRLQATIDSTIINGGGLGRVVNMQSVNGANTGIIGFTLTNGQASRGAGIYCYSSSTQISHNVLRGNKASDRGGGIYCTVSSSIRITHNFIVGDTATSLGGGISVEESSPTIDSNEIKGNRADRGGGIDCNGNTFNDIYENIIRHNQATNGGGIRILGGSLSTIRNNIIDSNVAVYGGGIECNGASPSIVNNIISVNSTTNLGGGIVYWFGSSPYVKGNSIIGNQSPCGGGIYAGASHATVEYNIIAGNNASEGGGGITSLADTSSIVNNTFDNNSGADGARAGGICCWSNAVPEIKQNIIVNSSFGYGIGCSPGSNPVISYNDVWDNYSGNFYGCPPGVGDTSWGENCNKTPCDSFYNIIQDPLFNPDSTNYFLLCNSPCIDAGDPSDSVPPGGGRYVDMGAVEYPYVCGDANSDGKVTISDVVYINNYLFRGGKAPCPMGATDANRDCEVSVSDVVYLINYLFKGGPPPVCGGGGPFLANSLSKLCSTSPSAEISLSEPRFIQDGTAEITIAGKFDIELAAIQLEVNYDPKQIKLIEPVLTPRVEGLQIYFGAVNGEMKIGILDITGAHLIPAGNSPILTLKAEAKDLSSLKICTAILVDENANEFLANVVQKSEKVTLPPDEYSLSQNYPNPFNPETEMSYVLPNASYVKLSIYNLLGQKVKTLVDGYQEAGYRTVLWDGKNDRGEGISSGIYFYSLKAGDFTQTRKMVLMK